MNRARHVFRSALFGSLAAAGILVLASCADRAKEFELAMSPLQPVALLSSLVFVDSSVQTAYVLDVTRPALLPRQVAVGAAASTVARRNEHDEALVLCRGERGGVGVAPEASSLTVVPGSALVASRRYELGSPFNAIAQTPDGARALVHFRTGDGLAGLLFNPNEIAIVDLDAPPSASNPVRRTVRSFGGVPTAVFFSPPMALPEGPRTLAVILSDAYVTLLDVDHPERPEITVPLALPEDRRAVLPVQVLFDPDDPTVYVRASASDDIFALRLQEVPASERTSNDFHPSLTQLAVGSRPNDMALFDAGDGKRLIVPSRVSSNVAIVDARSSSVTTIALDVAADRVLVFDATAPGDPTTSPRALLYAADGTVSATTFVDLVQVEERRGRNVETSSVGRPIVGALPLLSRGLMVLQHSSSTGAPGLSLLDLAARTSAPIYADVPLEGATFGTGDSRIYVAPSYGVRLGFLDLGTFVPGEVRLDASITGVLPLAGVPIVAVVHSSYGGHVTLLDADDLRRERARSVQGFLLSDLLARGAE
jgi:hypothetical protein